jgi:hypothetical protein
MPLIETSNAPSSTDGPSARQASLRLGGWTADLYVGYLVALAAGSIGLFLGIAILYARQPIMEAHGFRQAHTALTAYWMMRDGFSFAYETPVAGYPWTIPWEFPLYQAIVAGVTTAFGGNLDANGRMVSAAFLIACIAPAWLLIRRLGLSREVWLSFVALLFTSPIYLFWGRTFLIETTALLFGLSFLALALRCWEPDAPVHWAVLAGTAGTLAGLQKATVGLPFLASAGALWLWSAARRKRRLTGRDIVNFSIAIVIPVIAAFAWNAYTDTVKQHNVFASGLTTTASRAWTFNFGTIAQRLQPHPWKLVLWDRVLVANGGGLLGVVLLAGVLVHPRDGRLRSSVAAALLLMLVPVAVFTNLHAVHDYYQSEIVVFLLLALAIAIAQWLPLVTRTRWISALALLLLILSNLWHFWSGDLVRAQRRFDPAKDRILVIADVIKKHTAANTPIVVYGFDWSSEVPYYAERRAFCVPPWFLQREAVWARPESFLGGDKPSAVVICPDRNVPSDREISLALQADPGLSEIDVVGCRVLLHDVARASR